METRDGMKLEGLVGVTVRDADGKLLFHEETKNLVTLAGRNLVRDLLSTGAGSALSLIGIGTGSTPAAAGDTALEAEVDRRAPTELRTEDGRLVAVLNLGTGDLNGVDLSELGLFSADGTLFARTVHGIISKTPDVTIVYTWTINLGAV